MEQEDQKSLFEDKYQKTLGMSYEDWETKGPQNEAQAMARCMEIDRELNRTYDEWFEAKGEAKDKIQDYRDKLKAEYDFIEEVFHLEANDRNW